MIEMLKNYDNAIEGVNAYTNSIIADESKEEMTVFLDMTTIKQRMKTINVLDSVYHDPNIGWARAAFIAGNRNENGEEETVSLVVEPLTPGPETSMIEKQKKQSLETEAKLWNSVKKLIYENDIHSTTNSIIKEIKEKRLSRLFLLRKI